MAEELRQEIDLRNERGVAGALLADGRVQMRPVKDSRECVYRARGIDRVTLGTLMRLAEKCVRPRKGSPGRRLSVEGAGEVKSIGPRQYVRMKTMANSLAAHLNPAAARRKLRGFELWDTIDDESLFIWDLATTDVSGWTRMREVVGKSAPKHVFTSTEERRISCSTSRRPTG